MDGYRTLLAGRGPPFLAWTRGFYGVSSPAGPPGGARKAKNCLLSQTSGLMHFSAEPPEVPRQLVDISSCAWGGVVCLETGRVVMGETSSPGLSLAFSLGE